MATKLPRDGKQGISTYLPIRTYEVLKLAANALDESIQMFITEAINASLEKRLTKSQRIAIESLVDQISKTTSNIRDKQ
jgi:hypothetical protein